MCQLEKHYKLAKVAELLDISTRTLRRRINDGQLKAGKFETGKGWEYRIPVSELKRLGFGVTNGDD